MTFSSAQIYMILVLVIILAKIGEPRKIRKLFIHSFFPLRRVARAAALGGSRGNRHKIVQDAVWRFSKLFSYKRQPIGVVPCQLRGKAGLCRSSQPFQLCHWYYL